MCGHDLCVWTRPLCVNTTSVCGHDLCVWTRPLCVHRQQKSSYTHSCLRMLNVQFVQLMSSSDNNIVWCASCTAGVLLFVAHSPDNSFMGFVVEQHLLQSKAASVQRKNQAVVYGKALYMWQVATPRPSLVTSNIPPSAHYFPVTSHVIFDSCLPLSLSMSVSGGLTRLKYARLITAKLLEGYEKLKIVENIDYLDCDGIWDIQCVTDSAHSSTSSSNTNFSSPSFLCYILFTYQICHLNKAVLIFTCFFIPFWQTLII